MCDTPAHTTSQQSQSFVIGYTQDPNILARIFDQQRYVCSEVSNRKYLGTDELHGFPKLFWWTAIMRMILNTSNTIQYALPIVSKKKYTFWCEDCNAVFDELTMANEHQEKEKHRMNQTEYFASC